MLVLAIESSCDETSVCIMQKNKKDLHTMTGRFLEEDCSSTESSGSLTANDSNSAESHEATKNS